MTEPPAQDGALGTPSRPTDAGGGAPRPSGLSQMLGGDMPCVFCHYNLRGLSIRSVCPECGTAVRATILAIVDPHATELEPITSPRLTALGLVSWIAGGLICTLLCWLPVPAPPWHSLWHGVLTGSLLVSALGALALVRPHAGVSSRGTIAAATAVLLYAPLAWLVWEVTRTRYAPPPLGSLSTVVLIAQDRGPTGERVAISLLATVIALLMRTNARLLVARSLALRTGRVDRQTILAIVAAAAVAALGEISFQFSGELPGRWSYTARLAGQILVPAGWALVTLGLVGSLLDAVRISRSIVMPAPSMGQVVVPSPR